MAATFGALYLASITLAILHLWPPWQQQQQQQQHTFFHVFAAVAYLAHSFIIAALRTQARPQLLLFMVFPFETDKAETRAGW